MTVSSSPASESGKARSPQILGHNGTASVHLTLAVCDYDHTRDVTSGAVRADGITLTPLVFDTIEEITFRFLKNLEWDVSELSFGKYIALASQGAAPMVAIPVFPSRVHRHSAIYVRADRGIKSAKDLNKRTIGIPEWAQTAGVYVRGFLAEEYGVDLSSIQWLQADSVAAGGRQSAWPRREGCAQVAGWPALCGTAGGEPLVDAGQRRDRRGDHGARARCVHQG